MTKIPLSVSSTLAPVSGKEPLIVNPFGNETGKTGDAAPVLIAVEANGTVDVESFAAAMPSHGGQGTAAQARLIVNAIAQTLSELVDEYGAISVSTPFGRVETFVSGSLEYATDAVDPDKNKAYLGIVPGADVMKAFAAMEAFVPTSACPASLKRIRDVETADHVIHGTDAFYAQGYGMTYGEEGEKVELLKPDTREVAATLNVDEATKSEAQLKCTIPADAELDAGNYILRVITLAGTEKLWPLELRVTLADAIEPVVNPPTLTPGSFDTELQTDVPWSCDGTHLKGCKIHLIKRDEETEEIEIDKTLVESWDGSDTHAEITVGSTQVHEFENGANVELTFTNAAGSAHAGLCLDKGA